MCSIKVHTLLVLLGDQWPAAKSNDNLIFTVFWDNCLVLKSSNLTMTKTLMASHLIASHHSDSFSVIKEAASRFDRKSATVDESVEVLIEFGALDFSQKFLYRL